MLFSGWGGPKRILGVADFVFSWKRTRPLEAARLFMRRWNKLPKCFSMWNNQIARLLSRLFLAFGSTFACRRFYLETVQLEKGARSRAAIRSHPIQFDNACLRAASLFIWKRWNGALPSGPPSLLGTLGEVILWVCWGIFANSQISSGQELRYTPFSLIRFIVWGGNGGSREAGVFAGQQADSRPVNPSTLTQKHILRQKFQFC